MTQAPMRKLLIDTYLDWVNNYLTVEVFAEHYGLNIEQAYNIIALGKDIFSKSHPEKQY